MSIIVQKYGGSSVKDLDHIRRVAQKIVARKRQGHDLVVVVSAMGNTTDELLEMARELAANPSRRELDMLLSVGERISMALLSMAIQQEGFQAISLTGSQCGILTTDSHANARIMDVRPFRVQDELEKGHIVIVAGYQGTSYKREVTTLGRGGSDTTAVALAAALSAEACEIYSDVDGVFSADPRVILSAHQLATLSYDEMLEMARAGASVLNEQAVAFARDAGIALYARSTHLPHSQGTIVRPDGFQERAALAERGQPAVAVSHLNDGLHIEATERADDLTAALGGVDFLGFSWQPGVRSSFFLNPENVPDLDELTKRIEYMGARTKRCGAVSLIGFGIGGAPRWTRELLQVLAAQEITPLEVFISSARVSVLVAHEDVAQAARLAHASFVEPAGDVVEQEG